MRNASIIAVIAIAASACQSENELRFVSTLDAVTNGVVFTEDGNDSHVGMEGMTCTISTEWGCPIDDADLPTQEERILDHFEGVTLASSVAAVHKIDSEGWLRTEDVAVSSVRAARYASGGMLMLRGDADACFVQRGEEESQVPGLLCDDGIQVEVDRSKGALYAATPDGVYVMDASGAEKMVEGDLVAWDPSLNHVYTATTGDTTIVANTRDGDLVWTADVGLPIGSIATRGKKGQLLVLAEGTDGFGSLIRLDGADGTIMGSSDLPDSEGDLEVSGNGHTVAVVRSEEVHYFSLVLESEGETEVVERDPPSCLQDDRVSAD